MSLMALKSPTVIDARDAKNDTKATNLKIQICARSASFRDKFVVFEGKTINFGNYSGTFCMLPALAPLSPPRCLRRTADLGQGLRPKEVP
jgi:hypothetical protein